MKRLKNIFLVLCIFAVSICCFACKEDKKGEDSKEKEYVPIEIISISNIDNDNEIYLYYGIDGLDSYKLEYIFNPSEASYKDLDVSISGENKNAVSVENGVIKAQKVDGTAMVTFTAKKGSFTQDYVVHVTDTTIHDELVILDINGQKGTDMTINWNVSEALKISLIRPVSFDQESLMFEFKSSEIDNLNIANLEGGSGTGLTDETNATDDFNKMFNPSGNGILITVENEDATLVDSFKIKISYNYFTGENANKNVSFEVTINVVK